MRILISTLLLVLPLLAAPWESRANESGVRVETRKSPKSAVDEFRAIATINTPLENAVAFVEDYQHSADWIMYCKEDKIIEKTDPNHYTKQTITELPWPLSPRDSVAVFTKTVSEKNTLIEFHSAPTKIAKKADTVRIEILEGFWLFEPLSATTTKVTYQVVSDPKNLPSWLVNSGIVDQPLTTLKNMKKILEKRGK